jgi:hypothetical protein
MAASGTLQPADMVLAQDAAKWQPASAVPGLFPPPPPAVSADGMPPETIRETPYIPDEVAATPATGLGTRLFREVKETCRSTGRHVAGTVRYLRALWARRALQRQVTAAALALGERAYQAGLGEPPLRAQIASLDDQIRLAQAGNEPVEGLRQQREKLLIPLGNQVLGRPGRPAELAEQARRVEEARAELGRHLGSLGEARAVVAPTDGASQRRLVFGYGTAAACLMLLLFLALRGGSPPEPVVASAPANPPPGKADTALPRPGDTAQAPPPKAGPESPPVDTPKAPPEIPTTNLPLPEIPTTKQPPPEASFELPPVDTPKAPPEIPTTKQPPEPTIIEKGENPKTAPADKPVKKPAEPRKPKADPVDLRAALKQAGFGPRADQYAIERFVRYGTPARAQRALRGDQFDRLEMEKELKAHAVKVASDVYVLKDLPVFVPRRNDFAKKGLFVHCPLAFRLEIFGADPATLPKPFRKLYGASVNTLSYHFLTKQQTLRRCIDLEEVAAVSRVNGIFYHPETGTTQLILQLDLDFDTAKKVSQQTRDYTVDLVIDELRYEKAPDWGYFHRGDLLREDYDCEKLVTATVHGAPDPTIPPYFQVEERRFPWLVRAALLSVRLKDSSGKVLASFPAE